MYASFEKDGVDTPRLILPLGDRLISTSQNILPVTGAFPLHPDHNTGHTRMSSFETRN